MKTVQFRHDLVRQQKSTLFRGVFLLVWTTNIEEDSRVEPRTGVSVLPMQPLPSRKPDGKTND